MPANARAIGVWIKQVEIGAIGDETDLGRHDALSDQVISIGRRIHQDMCRPCVEKALQPAGKAYENRVLEHADVDGKCVFRHPSIDGQGRWYGGCSGGLASERGYGVVQDDAGNYVEFLGMARDGMASGTGGMIVRKSNEIGAVYHEGSFRGGLPDGVVRVEVPGGKPRVREFRAGLDVGRGDENQLKLLEF